MCVFVVACQQILQRTLEYSGLSTVSLSFWSFRRVYELLFRRIEVVVDEVAQLDRQA